MPMNSKQRREVRRLVSAELCSSGRAPVPFEPTVTTNRLSKLRTLACASVRFLCKTWLLITAISTLIGIVAVLIAAKPSVSVDVINPIYAADPLSVQFKVKNTGWFALRDISFSCEMAGQSGSQKFDHVYSESNNLAASPFGPNQAPVGFLAPEESTTKSCGVQGQPVDFRSLLDFEVTAHPAGLGKLFGTSKFFTFRFSSEDDGHGRFVWIPQAREESTN